MEQAGWLNRERGVAGALLLLCLWQVQAYFFGAEPLPEIPFPKVEDRSPARSRGALQEPVAPERALTRGRDVFVPQRLLFPVRVVIAPRKPDGPSKPEAPVGPAKPPPGEGRPAAAVVVLPPLPAESPEEDAADPELPEREVYRLPVEVKGWVEPKDGAPLRVIVTKTETGETFTMQKGEDRGGLKVRTLTPELVEFVNEEGRIVPVERDDLGQEGEAGAGDDLLEDAVDVFGGSEGTRGDGTGDVDLKKLKKVLPGGKGTLPKGLDLGKLKARWDTLDAAEKKRLMERFKKGMGQ